MGRIVGYPSRPEIGDRANCGPTVLAAVLGVDTTFAIGLMHKTTDKGWNGYTNVGHIRRALAKYNIKMVKVGWAAGLAESMSGDHPLLLFIQIDGPWMGKGWRSEYTHTHWALYHKDHIMDVNNILSPDSNRPVWVSMVDWEGSILPGVVDSYDGGFGWHVRSAYLVKEE